MHDVSLGISDSALTKQGRVALRWHLAALQAIAAAAEPAVAKRPSGTRVRPRHDARQDTRLDPRIA